jgi:hypothetical protein
MKHVVLAGVCCVLSVSAALVTLALKGVSVHAVLDSLVLLPSRVFAQNRNWFYAPQFSPLSIAWGLAGLGIALTFLRNKPVLYGRDWRRLLLIKSAFSAFALIAMPLRPDFLPLAGGFAWLVLFPADAEGSGSTFPRKVLCSVAVMQTLYAYPGLREPGNVHSMSIADNRNCLCCRFPEVACDTSSKASLDCRQIQSSKDRRAMLHRYL